MKIVELPPVDLLNELFDYDPLTGLLRWKKTQRNGIKLGAVAGTLHSSGYVQIVINRQAYRAHRICWAIYYNEQLSLDDEIDHKYGIRNDNRISELRKSNRQDQGYNQKQRSTNTSGHRGVTWDKSRQLWLSQIMVNYKTTNLGRFKTKEEAIEARLNAEKDLNIFVGERTEVR